MARFFKDGESSRSFSTNAYNTIENAIMFHSTRLKVVISLQRERKDSIERIIFFR